MPEVSVNIAYAPEGAKSVEGVVAIPGRIVRVRGQARSFMRPEYGASTHLAAILLEVERKRPSLRAAINLRYDERMSRVLAELRVERLTIGHDYPAGSSDKVLGALRARLSAPGRVREFGAVIDLGGEGVEPSLYLFAEDAIKVVRRSLEIARTYASSS
jgi:predicted fused transcriptional regulator/phosphomethylpyrimidine kinase